MKRMQDAGAESFVLDLRDNPGGLVQVFMSFHPQVLMQPKVFKVISTGVDVD